MEWVAISFLRGSSQVRNGAHVSCIGRRILYHEPADFNSPRTGLFDVFSLETKMAKQPPVDVLSVVKAGEREQASFLFCSLFFFFIVEAERRDFYFAHFRVLRIQI